MVHNLAFTYEYNAIINQPITQVIISHDQWNDEWKKWYKWTALWDTWAMSSCIADNIAMRLWLPIITTGKTKGIDNLIHDCNVYLANVKLPNNQTISVQLLWIAERDDFSMLIWMDVITQGEFALSTYQGTTNMTFCIPWRRHTDFVKEINNWPKKLLWRRHPCICQSWKKYKDCCEKKDKAAGII